MTNCFQKMYSFSFSISPLKLRETLFTDRDLNYCRCFIDDRTRELQLLMRTNLHGTNSDLDKKLWLRSVQLQLVGLSDDLNHYLCRENKIWEVCLSRIQIRQMYLYCINKIQDLIGYAKYYFFEWFDHNVKLTDLTRKTQLPEARCKVNELEHFLKSASIKEELTNLVIQQLRSVLKGRNFSSEQFKYIEQLSEHILMQESLNDKVLMGILVDFNFNSQSLFLYRSNEINESLDTVDSLHDQHGLILKNLDSFRSIEMEDVALDYTRPSLGFHLFKFCEKKIAVLEKMMESRRMAMQDKSMIKSTFRILTGLSVPQLALFVKAQMETGILLKQKVTEIGKFVALNFYTEKAEFISADSFIKKMTYAEFSTAVKLWEALELAQDWLDEKYDVKRYLGLR